MTLPCDVFLEFLEAVLHSVLYIRGIYHPKTFRKSTLYRTPVHVCLHRGVRDYLVHIVQCVRPFLLNQQLEYVSVLVIDSGGRVFEEIRIEVCIKASVNVHDSANVDDPWLVALEENLRAVLQRIYHLLSQRPAAPDNCCFRVQMSVTGETPPSLDPDFPIITACSREPFSTIIPVHTVSHETMNVHVLALRNNE